MFALLVAVVVLPSVILGFPITGCGGGIPAPTSLNIPTCPDSPCHVNNGGSMTYTVGFTPNAASNTMTLSIQSTVFGEQRELELSPQLSNACNAMSPPCPVAAGQPVTQTATIPVSSEYHGGIPARLTVTMTNAQGVPNMCAEIDIVIH